MLETIIESSASLSSFVKEYRSAFKNKAQYGHFMAYVLALLVYLGSKNLTGISKVVPGRRDESSLYRFLTEQEWDIQQVKQTRLEMLNRKARRALKAIAKAGELTPVFLIIDDSLVQKTGKTMGGVAKHRSHISKRSELGHVWVTGQLVVTGYSYAVEWLLYRKQSECEQAGVTFVSKPKLAEQIIREFEPLPDTITYVLTDSWYSSKELLNICQQREFKYIGAVRPNRKFKIAGHNQQARVWVQTIANSAFDRVKVKGVRYKTWSALGRLSSGHQVKILFNRRIGHKKWRYLISTDLDLSPHTLLRFYLTRWEVENFYRAIKQNFGWGDYQMRSLTAIERHVLLVMVAHAFIELQRHEAAQRSTNPKMRFTLGSLQRSLQRTVQRATIQHVFELTNAGFDLETIYHRLAV
jgi:SRSO17 transposase